MARLAPILAAVLALLATAAQAEEVDMLLVLAIDGSGSTRDGDFVRQTRGHAAAFRDPDVIAALTSGPRGKVAVAAFVWSFEDQASECADWTVIRGKDEASAFAAALARCPFIGGGTSVRWALEVGRSKLDRAPHSAERRVIDISANEKSATIIEPWRLHTVRAGITINALVLDEPDGRLAGYYRDFVIGGPGAFVIAADGNSYLDSLIRKLRMETARAAPAR